VIDGQPQDVEESFSDDDAPSRLQLLERIGLALATKRTEAINGRRDSGIEEVWMAAEEAYVGIDNANRAEFGKARWAKPMSMDGPLTRDGQAPAESTRSTLYLRMSSRYVDAGTAKVGEILLPVNDKAFTFDATPVPELSGMLENDEPIVVGGQTMLRAPMAGEGDQPVPITFADLAKQEVEKAQASAKAAEKRIYDWMVECNARAEDRKTVFDMGRIGVGVTKGPIPFAKRRWRVDNTPTGAAMTMVEELVPVVKHVDPWKFYPDPACGENIHDGDYVFEYDWISPAALRRLKKQPGFLADQIDKVLAEGPNKVFLEGGTNPNDQTEIKQRRYQIWYYTGSLTRQDMETIGADLSGLNPAAEDVFAVVTMVNDSVIRATVNPLDSGELPYDAIPWQRRAGHWAGVGIGEQLFAPQRLLNGAARKMSENAGKSAGSVIVVDREKMVPADGNWVIGGVDKIFYSTENAAVEDVRKAVAVFELPNRTDQLLKIIEFAFRLAEESTNIPLITQGMSGATTPETFGATQLQNNNANQLLRSIGYQYDDYCTEPRVRRFYEWLMHDPDVPPEEKGDWDINARGSAALVERAIQDQTLEAMSALVVNPQFGIDPKKWADEYLASKRLDPRKVKYTEAEQQEIDNAPPPKAPAVEAAEIRAASAERIETARLAQKERMAVLQYGERNNANTSNIKARLAETAAKINLQRELSDKDRAARQAMKPPAEPGGRAPAGEAFER